MRQFENRIAEIIEDSNQNLNTICKNSGISHTYLTKVIRGKINCPGKDKIASILLALNYTIGEINQVLADYDYRPLNRHDIPEIKNNNRKRKIEGNIMPLFDHIYVELLLSSMEQLGGTKVLIKNRPSSVYMPEDLYLWGEFPFEAEVEAKDFRVDLALALFKERRDHFLKNCDAGYRVETYICKRCLEDYLDQKLEPASAELSKEQQRKQNMMVQYFANALGAIKRKPEQFHTQIINRCPYFECQLQDADGKSPKVSFPGKKLHDYENRFDKINLEGFTSDTPAIIALFKNEVEICKMTTNEEISSNYPDNYIAYIMSLFRKKGLENNLEEQLEESLSKREYMLF